MTKEIFKGNSNAVSSGSAVFRGLNGLTGLVRETAREAEVRANRGDRFAYGGLFELSKELIAIVKTGKSKAALDFNSKIADRITLDMRVALANVDTDPTLRALTELKKSADDWQPADETDRTRAPLVVEDDSQRWAEECERVTRMALDRPDRRNERDARQRVDWTLEVVLSELEKLLAASIASDGLQTTAVGARSQKEMRTRDASVEEPSSKFRLNRNDCEIRYRDGKLNVYPRIDGFGYLFKLIEKQGFAFTGPQLRADKHLRKGDRRLNSNGCNRGAEFETHQLASAGEATDNQAIEEYQKRLQQLEPDLQKAKENNDEAEKSKLYDEKQQIEDHVKRVLGLNGKGRKLSSIVKNDRDTVLKAIKTALSRVKEKDKKLRHHFENALDFNSPNFTYRPEGETHWELYGTN